MQQKTFTIRVGYGATSCKSYNFYQYENITNRSPSPGSVSRLQVEVIEGDANALICCAVEDEATLGVGGVVLGVAGAGKLTTQPILAEE